MLPIETIEIVLRFDFLFTFNLVFYFNGGGLWFDRMIYVTMCMLEFVLALGSESLQEYLT